MPKYQRVINQFSEIFIHNTYSVYIFTSKGYDYNFLKVHYFCYHYLQMSVRSFF